MDSLYCECVYEFGCVSYAFSLAPFSCLFAFLYLRLFIIIIIITFKACWYSSICVCVCCVCVSEGGLSIWAGEEVGENQKGVGD